MNQMKFHKGLSPRRKMVLNFDGRGISLGKVNRLESDPYYWMDGTDARDLEKQDKTVDPIEAYKNNLMWNGDDAEGTMHPYFVFDGLRFERGYIEAVGYIGGREAARHRVSSYGKPAQLNIVPDDKYAPLRADGNDFIFVDADILDADGNPVYGFADAVEFTVKGGFIVGPSVQKAIAGKATIMLKAGDDVTVTAKCGDMEASALVRTIK